MRTPIRAVLAAAILTACTPATRKPDTTELDGILRAAVDAKQTPAVVAMAATNDSVIYQGAVGVPMDAIFAIASMTKPVTSVAVMQLVEAGKVQLDEPVHTYLPELRTIQVLDGGALRAPKSPPTVRHLLSHMSGFAYEFFNPAIAEQVKAGKVASAFKPTDEFLRAPLVFDPGTRWEYGISTDWLGKLVEAVSGQTLDQYFRASIFEPLGMSETYFIVPPDKAGRLAPQYAKQPDGSFVVVPRETQPPPTFFSGGGGLYSTASDYLRFERALLAGGELDGRRILKAETVALMGQDQLGTVTMPPFATLNPQVVASNVALPGNVDGFGLGFALNRRPVEAGRGVGTMSWAGIFNTYFWIDREKGVCGVVLTQWLPFGSADATELVEDFARAVYRVAR